MHQDDGVAAVRARRRRRFDVARGRERDVRAPAGEHRQAERRPVHVGQLGVGERHRSMNGVAELEEWPARDRQRMPAGAVCDDDTPGGRQRGPRTVVAVRIARAAGQLEGEARREIAPHRQSHFRPRNVQPVVPHVHQAALGSDQPGTRPDGTRRSATPGASASGAATASAAANDRAAWRAGRTETRCGVFMTSLCPDYSSNPVPGRPTAHPGPRIGRRWRPDRSTPFTIRHHTASGIGRRRRAASAQFLRCLQRPVNTGFRLASSADIPSRASSVARLAA